MFHYFESGSHTSLTSFQFISEAFLHSDPPAHVACGDDRGGGAKKSISAALTIDWL